jgi:DNA-binding Lrp family transcriptional regulator
VSDLVKLDRIDLKILARVQEDGRIANNKLADQVGLSPSPCLQRRRRLEKLGIIERYQGVVELSRVCRHVTVIATVTLRSHGPDDFEKFEAAVCAMPQAVECIKASGTIDYMLRFVCSDLESYHELSDQLLKSGPSVSQLSSHVMLSRIKPFDGYPLESLV